MAIRPGNDYLIWVAAPGGSPTYAMLGGQQDLTIDNTRQTSDASHKTSGNVALKILGLRDVVISTPFVADLPDTGYTTVETAYKGNGNVLVQIRKDGATGTAPDDVVFAALMLISDLSVNAPLNGALAGNISFELAAAPTTDLTLS